MDFATISMLLKAQGKILQSKAIHQGFTVHRALNLVGKMELWSYGEGVPRCVVSFRFGLLVGLVLFEDFGLAWLGVFAKYFSSFHCFVVLCCCVVLCCVCLLACLLACLLVRCLFGSTVDSSNIGTPFNASSDVGVS